MGRATLRTASMVVGRYYILTRGAFRLEVNRETEGFFSKREWAHVVVADDDVIEMRILEQFMAWVVIQKANSVPLFSLRAIRWCDMQLKVLSTAQRDRRHLAAIASESGRYVSPGSFASTQNTKDTLPQSNANFCILKLP